MVRQILPFLTLRLVRIRILTKFVDYVDTSLDTSPVRQASALCAPSSPTGACYHYVCTVDCDQYDFPADAIVYANLSSAISEQVPHLSNFFFLASSGRYLEPIQLYSSYAEVEFVNYRKRIEFPDNTRAVLGKTDISAEQLSIRFSGLAWQASNSSGDDCITIEGETQLSVRFDACNIACGLVAKGTLELSFSSETAFSCDRSCSPLRFSLNNGFFQLINVTTHVEVQVEALKSSNFTFSAVQAFAPVSITSSPSSRLLVDGSSFSDVMSITFPQYIKNTTTSNVIITNSNFNTRLELTGTSIGANISKNRFLGLTSGTFDRPFQNLLLSATCRSKIHVSRNSFEAGTIYVALPSERQASNLCPGGTLNPYMMDSWIQRNAWNPPPKFHQSGLDFLSHPVHPAIAVINSETVDLAAYTDYDRDVVLHELVVDADRNFWGDSSGPWVCCSPHGKGQFTTQLVKNNIWCLTPDCTTFNNPLVNGFSQNSSCITRCCTLVLSRGEFAAAVGIVVVSCLAFLALIVFSLWKWKFEFSERNLTKVDLLDRGVRWMFLSAAASLLAGFAVASCEVIVLLRNARTRNAPRQEKLQIDGWILSVGMLWMAVLHLIWGVLLAIAIILHQRKRPAMLRFVSSKCFVFHLVILAVLFILSLFWIPTRFNPNFNWALISSLETSGASNLVTVPSAQLGNLVYLPLIISTLATIAILIPNNMLNQILYYYHYSTINSALQTALLPHLASSPEISKKILKIRVAASINIVFLVILIAAFSYELHIVSSQKDHGLLSGLNATNSAPHPNAPPTSDPVISKQLPLPVVTMLWNPGRWIIAIGCSSIALISLIASLWAPYFYKRVVILTIISTGVLLSVLMGLENVLMDLVVFGLYRTTAVFPLYGALLGLNSVVIVASLTIIIMLWKLRTYIIEQIPILAISNLNTHLDSLWQANTIQRGTKPLNRSTNSAGSGSRRSSSRHSSAKSLWASITDSEDFDYYADNISSVSDSEDDFDRAGFISTADVGRS